MCIGWCCQTLVRARDPPKRELGKERLQQLQGAKNTRSGVLGRYTIYKVDFLQSDEQVERV